MSAAADRDDSRRIDIRELGRTDYETTWQAMRAFTDTRGASTVDQIWLTEHSPIYTLGLAGRAGHLRRDNGIRVVKSDRGGQITYHGPGQLVLYSMLDLRRLRIGVRELVRTLEACVIDWLGSFGVAAWGREDRPGVYVDFDGREAKIAALGLRVRNGCTYHGLALNVEMDLSPFADIDPCGYEGLAVTQLADVGVETTVDAAGRALASLLVDRLQQRVARAEAIPS